jgi:hypothetical protein
MDARKKQAAREEFREKYRKKYRGEQRDEGMDLPEFEIPEEMEAWALDDMSDLVPTVFD